MVEPVKYKPENVVEVKPGDVIPEKSIVFHEDGHQWMPACEIIASHNVTHYAPAPILELPQEVEFGEAMRRMTEGESLNWRWGGGDICTVSLGDAGMFMVRNGDGPSSGATPTFLYEGTFYALPAEIEPQTASNPEDIDGYGDFCTTNVLSESAKEMLRNAPPLPRPQVKATSLKWWEAIEAIQEPAVCGANGSEFYAGKTGEHQLGRASRKPRGAGNKTHKHATAYEDGDERHRTKAGLVAMAGEVRDVRNKRSVWTVNTKPFKGAHFAVFPPDLIKPCILAGCPPGGVVLDPFLGSGTTAKVAKDNGCKAIGIEVNPEYAEIAVNRFKQRVMEFIE